MKEDMRSNIVRQEGNVVELKNAYLSILVGPDGRFNSGAVGNLSTPPFNIIYRWPDNPWSSFTTVRIDGVDYVFGTDGEMIEAPHNYTDDLGREINRCRWQYGDVIVTQYVEIGYNSNEDRLSEGAYIYNVYNTSDTTSHDVGIRVMIDTMVNGNDGIPFSTSFSQVGTIKFEKEYDNTNNRFAAFSWYTLYSFDTPKIGSQGDVMNRNYYGIPDSPIPLPDKLAFCAWQGINTTLWGYVINPERTIVGDSAIAYWWNPISVAPRKGYNCVSHMGLSELRINEDVGVSAPEALSVEERDGLFVWVPNPFAINWVVRNGGPLNLTAVLVEIALTDGLIIYMPPEERIRQVIQSQIIRIVIPELPAGEIAQGSVLVEAILPGTWEYSISALGSTLTESIYVPALVTKVDLNITKVSSAFTAQVGQELEYTLAVKSLSAATANSVRVIDSLPSSVEFISIIVSQGTPVRFGNVIDWNVGSMATGTDVTAIIKVKPLKLGSITNTATVVAANLNPDVTLNNASVTNKVIGNLSTGPVIKDKFAKSIVVAINNTKSYPIKIDIVLQSTPSCTEKVKIISVIVPENCTKGYILGCDFSIYELIFRNVEEGVFIWTTTRREDRCVPGYCSHLISANKFAHSDLILL